jgi:hypothetical protein
MTNSDIGARAEPRYAYKTFGPLRLGSGVDLSYLPIANDFWNDIDETHPGARSATGVYIFVVKASKRSRLKPWYVGMTDITFENRFHNHTTLFGKLAGKKGNVSVFLIARLKPGSKSLIAGPKKSESNDILETMLIERCLDLNPKLFNASKVKHVKGLLVPGFKGKKVGKPKAASRQLDFMLRKIKVEEF